MIIKIIIVEAKPSKSLLCQFPGIFVHLELWQICWLVSELTVKIVCILSPANSWLERRLHFSFLKVFPGDGLQK